MQTLWYSLSFDISAVLFTNAVFILLVSFPFSFFRNKFYRILTKTLFLLVNGIAIFANCSDFAYFSFIHKRTTFDVFSLMGTQTDMGELLPVFLRDFWYVFIIAILFILVLHVFYNRLFIRFVSNQPPETNQLKPLIYRFVGLILVAGFTVIGMRGGFQLIPLGIMNAADNVPADRIALVLNTPFSIMKSAELGRLEEKKYLSEIECKKLFNPCKTSNDTVAFRKLNVVVIILESFSKEYTGLAGKESSTPFLDSLMKESHTFVNAYSNGKRSIEGIPAILSSIPSGHEPYLNTLYGGNKIQSLASILKQKGYSASFFHGGNNGTMSFDTYCNLAGFDTYFGRNEYANDADYDGSWGIWDEPFFERYESELSKMKEPFLSAIFSLSSHHPFEVPEKYKGKFKEGKYPINKCISYTDYSLKLFFESAKKNKWFSNTLFVLVADHTGPSADLFFANQAGNYKIPILFYQQNSHLKAMDSTVIQQADIMPGILSYLHYDKPYFAFGNDPFNKQEPHFAVNSYNGLWQYFYDSYLIEFNEKTNKERLFSINGNNWNEILKAGPDSSRTQALKRQKAFIQTYNNRLITNNTICE
ncbi:MAG: sulfatase-like hydrolase/transferase [Bacteroidota bacterium]|nr:sulfatase-like hydrolase/transferase [Bacteroidota bacterium]